jgi:hypothetical protein
VDRREVALDYIAACDDSEFQALVTEARGAPTRDVKTLLERELGGAATPLNDVGHLLRQHFNNPETF